MRFVYTPFPTLRVALRAARSLPSPLGQVGVSFVDVYTAVEPLFIPPFLPSPLGGIPDPHPYKNRSNLILLGGSIAALPP